jgi:hypothetical protein
MDTHDRNPLASDPRAADPARHPLRVAEVTHERCGCAECRKLDRRWPGDGYQLRLIDGGHQPTPTDEESAQSLFSLAGIDHIPRRRARFE